MHCYHLQMKKKDAKKKTTRWNVGSWLNMPINQFFCSYNKYKRIYRVLFTQNKKNPPFIVPWSTWVTDHLVYKYHYLNLSFYHFTMFTILLYNNLKLINLTALKQIEFNVLVLRHLHIRSDAIALFD